MAARRIAARTIVGGLVAGLVVAALTLVVGLFRVVGDSMAPTLAPGGIVLVDRLGVPPGDGVVGSIVAFHAPAGWETAGEVLVKRVVGAPGDIIAIYEGELHRNGVAVTEPYLAAPASTEARGRLIGEWVVGPSQFFLLGDNRSPSLDSRLFGPVDASRIIGRVLFDLP